MAKAKKIEETTVETKKRKIGPGKRIRNMFARLVKNGKIDGQLLMQLQDGAFTKENLGNIKYPFLKKLSTDIALHAQVKINGHNRYSTKPIRIMNEHYIMTNDIYKKNLNGFKAWYESLMNPEKVAAAT